MTDKSKLLILSFSPLATDARILKQIRMFQHEYEVTTCGFGPAPTPHVEHIEIQPDVPHNAVLHSLLLRTRRFSTLYFATPEVKQVMRLLKTRRFNAVIANDLDTLGVAVKLFNPATIHLDLHEYWPGLQDHIQSWRQLRRPSYVWQLRKWATGVASVTTVNQAIADRYRQEFGITCEVVPNASEYLDISPTPVHHPLRLVHSGGAQPSRQIERMMHAVANSEAEHTLDLYLVGEGTSYYKQLSTLADELGERVNILPPVPHEKLLETLNQYDVGIPFLPPTSTNNAMALPNKFFDYVQARVGILAGPTPAMQELIHKHRLGTTTQAFETESLTRAIEHLNSDTVQEWKNSAHTAARTLSSQEQSVAWQHAVARIVGETE